jgi:hypothetical protein
MMGVHDAWQMKKEKRRKVQNTAKAHRAEPNLRRGAEFHGD